MFKTRAYQNGARVVMGLDEDLALLVAEKRLTGVKGIGQALADKITELVTTDRLEYYEKLKSEFPAGFQEMLKVPGLGPKKARLLMTDLGIASLDELDSAARAGRLADLPGFGEKTQSKILEGIEHVRKNAGRYLADVAEAEATALLGVIRNLEGVEQISLAGSLRRRGETIKDIDLVVATSMPAPIMTAFTTAPNVEAVTGHGETKSSVRLTSGMAADLRCVSAREFPFALLYFTGSKAHNVALRGRAQKMGLKLNEYALERTDDSGERVTCADEAAIYRALGLEYIEPELREDTGEIEAAERGALPRLITRDDLKGVLHCHSTWSDGTNSIEEMAEAARAMGLIYLGLCDHSRAAAYAGGMSIERVREQHLAIDAINAKLGSAFRVLKGIEVDILADGSLDYPDEVLASFDLVVASVHSRFNLQAAEQTERMIRAVSNPFVDILGHPTGRLLLTRDPYPLDLFAVIDAAAERGVAVEINAHPQRLDLDPAGLRHGLAKGMKTSVNPDAHATSGLSDIAYGIDTARRGWCAAGDVLNALPLPGLLEWLRQRRKRAGL